MDPQRRNRRHVRIRGRVTGTTVRPRVSVYRSLRYVSVQLIDDERGVTLVAVHGKDVKSKGKLAQAQAVGEAVATAAHKAGITAAVFDRSGYRYHGRVRAIAEALRAGKINI